jgi:PTS system mannose-specific IID component
MKPLTVSALCSCYLRSYLVGAAYNTRGLQNIGFLFAIKPGLRALYPDGKALRDARMRYARHFNCHPFFTPLLLGAFLRTEWEIARGAMPAQAFLSLKDTMTNTLSAIGDSFFSGTLLSTWALVMGICVCAGFPLAAAGITMLLFALLQAFRIGTFILGLRKGIAFLPFLSRLNLINWGERLKCGNAVLLACFLWLIAPAGDDPLWIGLALGLPACAWLIGKLHLPRVLIALAALIFALFLYALPA